LPPVFSSKYLNIIVFLLQNLIGITHKTLRF